jgi:hypothetical protein
MKSSAADRSAATARNPFCLIFTGTKPDDGPLSSSSTGVSTDFRCRLSYPEDFTAASSFCHR